MGKFKVVAVVLLCMLIGGYAFADRVDPLEDVPVWSGSGWQNTNFNDYSGDLDSELWTGGFYGQGLSGSYLKFNTPTDPGLIQSAVLWMNAGLIYGASTVNVYATTNNWSETTMTWNNQPGYTTLIASAAVNNTGWWSWDLTSFAQSLSPDQEVSIAVFTDPTNAAGTVWYARETSTGLGPYIEAVQTPEPVSSALFLVGGTALAFLRRKRNG